MIRCSFCTAYTVDFSNDDPRIQRMTHNLLRQAVAPGGRRKDKK